MLLLAPLCQGPPAAELEAAPDARLEFDRLANGFRLRCDSVAGSDYVSFVFGVAVGTDDDPPGQTGLAEVVQQLLRLELPPIEKGQPVEVRVLGPTTLIGANVEKERAGDFLAFLKRLLNGTVGTDPDLVARAKGKALLRADTETAELPGRVLYWRARRLLLEGEPGGRDGAGVPVQIEALEPEQIVGWVHRYFTPDNAFLVVLGASDGLASSSARCWRRCGKAIYCVSCPTMASPRSGAASTSTAGF